MPNVTRDFERDNVLRKDNISSYKTKKIKNQVEINEHMEILYY